LIIPFYIYILLRVLIADTDIVFLASALDELEEQLQESKEFLEKAEKALEIESSESKEKPDIESLKDIYPWAFEDGEDLKDILEWICEDLKEEIATTKNDIKEMIESGSNYDSDSDSDSDRTITQEGYDRKRDSDLEDNSNYSDDSDFD